VVPSNPRTPFGNSSTRFQDLARKLRTPDLVRQPTENLETRWPPIDREACLRHVPYGTRLRQSALLQGHRFSTASGVLKLEAAKLPPLTIARNANGIVTVSWNARAAGSTLESIPQLGAGASWNPVGGVANPITAGGATTATPVGAQFYRLRE
jgi:hypothetical protein